MNLEEKDEKKEEDLTQEEEDSGEDESSKEQDEKEEETLDEEDESKKDQPNATEHTLDDLAEEDLEDAKHIPHVSSLGSQIPSSGVYSSHHRLSSGNKFHLIILVVIGVAVIAATVYLLKGSFNFVESPSPSPEETQTSSNPSPIPTATPQSLDRSKFKIRILNGTSKTGLAASVSAKLKDLGYQIEKTGNATNSSFTRTQVRVKESSLSLIDRLIKDLTPDFDGASSSALKASEPVDGEIILGTK